MDEKDPGHKYPSHKALHPLENMLLAEKDVNLVSQSWYIQAAGKTNSEARKLTNSQIELIYQNYFNGDLNENRHLNLRIKWHYYYAPYPYNYTIENYIY